MSLPLASIHGPLSVFEVTLDVQRKSDFFKDVAMRDYPYCSSWAYTNAHKIKTRWTHLVLKKEHMKLNGKSGRGIGKIMQDGMIKIHLMHEFIKT